ncbi:MAG: 2'-deoxycytidine 5'-triphosphate deaminase [Lachnospiraceae bacterium]|nr:2'-deoxycytidine 5'-triphosphate deaminase [Lachnospiraceae bacterium]
MVLTDKEIREYIVNYKNYNLEQPLISKFAEKQLQSESYDVTASNVITTLKKEVRCISIDEQENIDSIYEEINMKSEGYVISPKEYIMVALNEQINLPDFLTAHIRPRTKFTRLGLIVSDQHCNSTYSGILKLGLYNATDYAIKIKSGVGIAQIVFEELKSKPTEEKLYKNKIDASYQDEKEFIGAKFDSEFNANVNRIVEKLLRE